MRFGATQFTPTASPLVIAEVGDHYFTSDGGGGNERIVSVKEDEQIWGGNTTILLDNSDGTLTNLDLRYKELKLIFSFIGQTSYEVGRLFVFSQSLISQEGKLLMTLNCIDGWGLLSLAKTSFANWYFNQEWQKEANIDKYLLPSGDTIPTELRAELIANSSRVLYHIINTIIMQTISRVVLYPGGVGLDYDPALYDRKPPISFANAISGVRQALEMTSSYIRWEGVGVFKQIRPNNHPVCYSYDKTNSSFRNVHEVGAVIPNQISFWAFNAAGDDWIEGIANDEQSQLELGQIIPRHFILAPELQVDARSTTEELTEIAEGMLDKIRQEREMGLIIAPMHCSQQLFDKIEVKDSRYSPDKTITGIVHRIVREYDRGKYQITLQVGGEGKSSTQEFGGNEAVPLYEAEPPRAPILTDVSDTKHLHITAAYSIPMTEVNLAYNVSDPGEALLAGEDLVIPVPTIGVASAQTTVAMPSDVYIHDGVNLIDTDVTAENNDDLQTYQACPTGPSLGDGLYVCHTAKFDCIQFYISTAGVGTYTFRASYFNGAAWVAIPSFYADGDDTGSFKVTGYRWVQFNRPADWALFEIDSKDRYILHMEINSITSMTTVPLLRTAVLGIW